MPLVITTETRTFSDPEGQIEEQSLSGLLSVSCTLLYLHWQSMIYLVLLDVALAKRSFVCVDNPEDIVLRSRDFQHQTLLWRLVHSPQCEKHLGPLLQIYKSQR